MPSKNESPLDDVLHHDAQSRLVHAGPIGVIDQPVGQRLPVPGVRRTWNNDGRAAPAGIGVVRRRRGKLRLVVRRSDPRLGRRSGSQGLRGVANGVAFPLARGRYARCVFGQHFLCNRAVRKQCAQPDRERKRKRSRHESAAAATNHGVRRDVGQRRSKTNLATGRQGRSLFEIGPEISGCQPLRTEENAAQCR